MFCAKKLFAFAGVWSFLFVFAMLCAAAIAEGEVLEEYRYLVYLGTALAILAFGVAVCAVWLILLFRLLGKLRSEEEKDSTQRISFFCRLLSRYRSRSFRSLISLHLVYAYLEAKENKKALTLLSLQMPSRCLYFDRSAYSRLFCVCAALYNDEAVFRRYCAEPILCEEFPFLEEEVKQRLHRWQSQ